MPKLPHACWRWLALVFCALGASTALADPASEYAQATDRVIVRLKGGAPKHSFNAQAREALAARLSAQGGEAMRTLRVMGDGAQVMQLNRRMPIQAIQALSRRFEHDAEVIEILPDRIFFPALSPNDPLFSQQWALSLANGINAPAAWDITTGANNLIIGIIDTGKLPHNDLAGRWIGGYDFVGDTNRSNDGDGRDADATDPGDWVTPAESAGGPLQGCPVTDSRWHGTAMAGVIAASANNGQGIAGINWNSKLLPVRVVGKCGAYESDIADGIRWAVGISVPNVPINPDTAEVLNVSLSTAGACSTTLQSAINEVIATGAAIIVAAGNNSLNASGYSPGNCQNVITVGAVDRNGGKPTYANFGEPIALSAPGGIAAIANGSPEQNWVLSTQNQGTTTASANNDFYQAANGTSIAAANVTGIASLMLSVNPSLAPPDVTEILKNSSRTFPVNTTTAGSQADCSALLCGSGIADAGLAVSAAVLLGSASAALSSSFFGTWALRSDGTVFRWGAGASLPTLVGSVSGVQQLSAGDDFGLVLRPEGIVLAMGLNEFGQVGDGTNLNRISFVRVLNLSGITKLAAGAGHGLALKSDGSVWSWGRNDFAQLGDGTTVHRSTPMQIAGLSNVTAIVGGAHGSFALKSNGTVWRWGSGIGSLPQVSVPTQVTGLSGISAIDGNASSHLLALKDDGTVWALGSNVFGQLGDGTNIDQATPVQVVGLSSVVQIRVGVAFAGYSLALKSDGTVWAWGNNNSGTLGDGTEIHRSVPVQVAGLSGVTYIEAGPYGQSLAIRNDGSVFAWGYNGGGGLGTGNTVNSPLPTQVLGVEGDDLLNLLGILPRPFAFVSRLGVPPNALITSNPVAISGLSASSLISVVGGEYSINGAAFTSVAGTVVNGDSVVLRIQSAAALSTLVAAELTIGGATGRSATFYVSTHSDAAATHVVPQTAAGDSHTLVLAPDGTVLAAGYNGNGQLGNGTTLGQSALRPVPGLAGVASIASGAFHSLARRGDGSVVAWGSNVVGQLGNNSATSFERYFVEVGSLTGVARISAGNYHSVALKENGTVWAWGLNTEGQVGDGSGSAGRIAPVQIPGLSGVTSIASGGRHNLALLVDGTVRAWGANESGQLGDGTTTQRNTPVAVSGLTNVIAIAAGAAHSLAIKSDGSVVAWGFNGFGQLGDGTTTNRLMPVAVTSLGTGVGLIAAGANHSLAVKAGGVMYSWGNNANSQLGTGNNTNSSVPVQLANPTHVVAISGGARHTAAIDRDRKLFVWGDNFFGQVGNRSGNYNPHSASLNVLRGDTRISVVLSGSLSGVGTGSSSGSSVLLIDGQATSFDFGQIAANGAKTTSGKYGNGSALESINNVALSVTGGGFSLQSHDCPPTLGPASECNFTIAFNPSGANQYAGELVIESDVVGHPEKRSLTGIAVGSAAITFGKNGMDFEPQLVGTPSGASSLTLTNTGSATLNVSAVTSSLPADFSASHNCAAVAPNASCAIDVVFTPTTVNARNAQLTITSNAAATPGLPMFGTGVANGAAPTVFTLSVAKTGSGGGTVASTFPASPTINCGDTCSASFVSGTIVTLTASSNAGSSFAGWSGGGCSGTGTCQVTMSSAVSVTASFGPAASVPGVPQALTASSGNGLAVFRFNPPANDGGSPILGYTALCTTGETTTGASSPITLTGLTNGNFYTCSVAAFNAAGTGPATGNASIFPSSSAPLSLTTVQSRKPHGAAGTFGLAIDTTQSINGSITIEPRSATTHSIVFVFTGPISATGTATAKDAANNNVGSVVATASANEVTVTLNGVPENQRLTVSLAGVNGTGLSPSAAIGFLVGDVDGSRAVTASDILRTKGRTGQAANSANYLYDTDRSAAINSTDVDVVKARAGTALP